MTLPENIGDFTAPEVDQYESELYRRYLEAHTPEEAQAAVSDLHALGRFICRGEQDAD